MIRLPSLLPPLLGLALLTLSPAAIAQQVTPETATPAPLPEMSEIETAWQRGDFDVVRAGLERLATETGAALAQYRYGRVLVEGKGGPQDIPGAITWLERAVAQNHVEAAVLLARIHLAGDELGVPRDAARAVALLRRAAPRGGARAQHLLGTLLRAGDGVAADPGEAFGWFLAAAEDGHPPAQMALAQAYATGAGVAADPQAAQHWLTEAAAAGLVEAQFALAQAHDTGTGVPKSPAQALQWYRRAAQAGLPLAQRILGQRHLWGEGAVQDSAEGLRWLEAAAEAGDPGAMANLGQAYAAGRGVAADPEQARLWFERAAASDLPRGMTALARLLETGLGGPADPDRAIGLYRRAAESGDGLAAQQLGKMAAAGKLEGRVAPQRAVPWAEAAARTGHVPARDWLAARAAEGLPSAQAAEGTLLLDDPDGQAQGLALLGAAAEAGQRRAQAALGQLLSTGAKGAPLDYVAAHAWLNIAATAGDSASAETRATIGALMTPDQIAAAQDIARAYYEAEADRVPRPPKPATDSSE